MQTIHQSCKIHASPELVWQVLTQLDTYPEWNPFIRELSGKLEIGGKLRVVINSPLGGSQTFQPVITGMQSGRLLEWRGKFLLPGIFDGTHRFVLEPTQDAYCNFIHAEEFGGVLSRPFLRRCEHQLNELFAAMNSALKQRAEARAAQLDQASKSVLTT